MKRSKQFILAVVLAASSAMSVAANLSFTNSHGTSSSIADVDRHVTGVVNASTTTYSQERGAQFACGAACDGLDANQFGVSATLSNEVVKTTLDQLTTGTTTTDTEFCDTNFTVGSLDVSHGRSYANTESATTTTNNNVSEIKGFEVTVSTQTDSNKLGALGDGDDFAVNLGDAGMFNSSGTFRSTDVTSVDTDDVQVNALNFSESSYGVEIKVTNRDLVQTDNTVTTNTSSSFSDTMFSSIN